MGGIYLSMPNRYVNFVSDKHFLDCVRHVCAGYYTAVLEIEKLRDNGLDPFKIIFDLINRKVRLQSWVRNEAGRQEDKSLNNRIGEFHQKLLGGVKGWKDLGTGDESKLDLVKSDNSIGIELKNKFNTVNSDSLDKVRDKLELFVRKNKSSKAYWAYIIEKDNSSGESIWIKKGRSENKKIIKIWGAEVYRLVTGDKFALKNTWAALPKAISEVFSGKAVLASEDLKKLQELFASAF
jgi:hypothetical protein